MVLPTGCVRARGMKGAEAMHGEGRAWADHSRRSISRTWLLSSIATPSWSWGCSPPSGSFRGPKPSTATRWTRRSCGWRAPVPGQRWWWVGATPPWRRRRPGGAYRSPRCPPWTCRRFFGNGPPPSDRLMIWAAAVPPSGPCARWHRRPDSGQGWSWAMPEPLRVRTPERRRRRPVAKRGRPDRPAGAGGRNRVGGTAPAQAETGRRPAPARAARLKPGTRRRRQRPRQDRRRDPPGRPGPTAGATRAARPRQDRRGTPGRPAQAGGTREHGRPRGDAERRRSGRGVRAGRHRCVHGGHGRGCRPGPSRLGHRAG